MTAQIARVQPAFVALQSSSVAGSAIIESAASCAGVNNTYDKCMQSVCTVMESLINCHLRSIQASLRIAHKVDTASLATAPVRELELSQSWKVELHCPLLKSC